MLGQYAATRDERAFAELVERHLDLVYAVALRKVGGDAHFAEDVAQRVFTDLARKAATLAGHPVLSGWLFTSTHYAASQLVRAERRRREREQKAQAMNELSSAPAAIDGERLRPLLDDLVAELSARDREAVLLRFFEGRGFAEVGARLNLSEDGARARVDRAVEKLQALLARRGITSASGALGLALANHASAAAPIGLAANVTTSALATGATAATGGGLAASLAALGFMGSTKITGGVIALALALALSATANGFLLWRTPAAPPAAAAPATRPMAAPVAQVDVTHLATADLALVRDRLRAAGVEASVARGVVEGALRRRYRDRLAEVRAEQMRTRWWQDSSWYFRLGGQPVLGFADDPRLLREMVLDPLEKLFGPDPLELAELDARFAFLAPEKRAAFVALERDYDAAVARAAGGESRSPAANLLNRERDEKRRALLAQLSPEERAEYEVHFSDLATVLRERMDTIGATEKEYRAIMAVIAPPGEGSPDRRGAAFFARDEQALQQLVPALGYDRAADYIWAGAREYASYARVAQEAGLPANTATRVLSLASETVERAIQIHGNTALSGEQRKAAVVALQQEIRPQLDALLPPPLQQKLAGEMMDWFTVLGQGRYRSISTSALGSGGLMIGAVNVETPLPPGAGRRQFVLRRPGGN